jgi:bifunctional DNA-binding transcriptional regulator/antitoxin component of YhaV-PrlF toxin-antitoxin module
MNTVARMIRGSVTIPAKVRKELDLEDGTIFGFEVFNGMLIMRRVKIVPVDGDMASVDDSTMPTGNGQSHKARGVIQPAETER